MNNDAFRGGEGSMLRTHNCLCELWTLVLSWWSEVGRDIIRMQGPDDGVLVSIADASIVGEGLGKPVGWADKGRLGIQVLPCHQPLLRPSERLAP